MVRVYVCEAIDQADLQCVTQALSLLPKAIADKIRAMGSEKAKCRSAIGWLLLRLALCDVYGMDEMPTPTIAPGGKPYFASCPDIHFNLSHCRRAVACAVGDNKVGIDVETYDRYKPELAQSTLNSRELASLIPGFEQLCFSRLWTRKESYVKFTGEGLRSHIPSILECAEKVKFTDFEGDGTYCLTLCTNSDVDVTLTTISLQQLEPIP